LNVGVGWDGLCLRACVCVWVDVCSAGGDVSR
jgi:hypothetical protein